jgi:hypothetical protein
MHLARYFTVSLALLLAAGLAAAQGHDGAWVSYRDAYRAMVVFEKYGGAKDLLQSTLQVTPGGLRLALVGKSARLDLPLDPIGRTSLPLLKSAYDENAVLVVDRKDVRLQIHPRVTLAVRQDGIYDAAELRAGCEEALAFARHADRSMAGRHCAAVRFVYPKNSEARVHARSNQAETALPVVEGAAFQGDADGGFPTVTYRFAAGHAQLVSSTPPAAIVPMFE